MHSTPPRQVASKATPPARQVASEAMPQPRHKASEAMPQPRQRASEAMPKARRSPDLTAATEAMPNRAARGESRPGSRVDAAHGMGAPQRGGRGGWAGAPSK